MRPPPLARISSEAAAEGRGPVASSLSSQGPQLSNGSSRHGRSQSDQPGVFETQVSTSINGHDSGSNAIDAQSLSRTSSRGDKHSGANALLASSLWLNKAYMRSQELGKQFNIPATEHMLDEFRCALRKKILLQGRLHVFEHRICFSSNVFGYITRNVMEFQDVVSVKKKTHFRLPNSIEFVDNIGRKAFFTSFLSRDDAYRLIFNCWNQAKARRKEAFHKSLGHESLTGVGASSMVEETCPALGHKSSPHPSTLSRTSFKVPRRSLADGMEDDGNDDDADDDGEETLSLWDLIDNSATPPREKDSRVLISTTLPGTTKTFYDVVLATQSSFLEDVLELGGNRRINIGTWKRQEGIGHVRDVQFTKPIEGAFSSWGVPFTQCYQSHRFCRYTSGELIFESSQTMTDIPYGDCFTVEIRWDVKEINVDSSGVDIGVGVKSKSEQRSSIQPSFLGPGPSKSAIAEASSFVKVEVALRIPFSRSCLFKRVIQSATNKQVLQNLTETMQALQGAMQHKLHEDEHESHMERINSSTDLGGADIRHHASTDKNSLPNMVMSPRPQKQASTPRVPSSPFSNGPPPQRTSSERPATNGFLRQMVTGFFQMVGDSVSKGASSTGLGSVLGLLILLMLLAQIYVVWMVNYSSPTTGGDNNLTTTTTTTGSSMCEGGGYPGGTGDASAMQQQEHWMQKLSFLQSDLRYLQSRLEAVTAEVAMTMQLIGRPEPAS